MSQMNCKIGQFIKFLCKFSLAATVGAVMGRKSMILIVRECGYATSKFVFPFETILALT